jgi:hypothetical protein
MFIEHVLDILDTLQRNVVTIENLYHILDKRDPCTGEEDDVEIISLDSEPRNLHQ